MQSESRTYTTSTEIQSFLQSDICNVFVTIEHKYIKSITNYALNYQT